MWRAALIGAIVFLAIDIAAFAIKCTCSGSYLSEAVEGCSPVTIVGAGQFLNLVHPIAQHLNSDVSRLFSCGSLLHWKPTIYDIALARGLCALEALLYGAALGLLVEGSLRVSARIVRGSARLRAIFFGALAFVAIEMVGQVAIGDCRDHCTYPQRTALIDVMRFVHPTSRALSSDVDEIFYNAGPSFAVRLAPHQRWPARTMCILEAAFFGALVGAAVQIFTRFATTFPKGSEPT